MSKTSIVLLILFIIALSTLLTLNTIYSPDPVLKSLPRLFPTKPITASENTLLLTPNAITAPAGRTTTIQIEIDSKGEIPSVIQMELAYDPNVLSRVTVTPGMFFTNPQVLLNNVNARNGRISYAITPLSDQTTPTGSKIVATIAITPSLKTSKRETSLYFLPKTIVKTKTSENTLKIAYGTKITVLKDFAPVASPSGMLINY